MTIDVAGTGSGATSRQGPASYIPVTASNIEIRRLTRVSDSVFVSVANVNGGVENIAAQAIRVTGSFAEPIAAASLNTGSNNSQIGACVCGTDLLFAYADSTNSGYPTTVPLPLGTIT